MQVKKIVLEMFLYRDDKTKDKKDFRMNSCRISIWSKRYGRRKDAVGRFEKGLSVEH